MSFFFARSAHKVLRANSRPSTERHKKFFSGLNFFNRSLSGVKLENLSEPRVESARGQGEASRNQSESEDGLEERIEMNSLITRQSRGCNRLGTQ